MTARLASGAAGLWGAVVVAAVAWLLLASPSATPANAAGGGPALDLTRYRLTFDESFDTLDVSPWGPGTRWIAHTPWNGDFGDAQFVDPTPGFPFTTDKGLLRIAMRRNAAGKLQSGLLASADRSNNGFVQRTGYFEMRARLPKGAGVWPAFWLSAIGVPGKPSPEIDIVEYYGHDPSAYMATAHVWRDGANLSETAIRVGVPPASLETGFHRYGVSVEAEGLTFYLDGRPVARMPPKPEYLLPKFILLDLGAGGGWPVTGVPARSEMEVDYVRAYVRR